MMKTALSATGRYLKQTDWLLMLCCVGLSSFSTLLIYSLYVNGEVGRLNTVLVQPAALRRRLCSPKSTTT